MRLFNFLNFHGEGHSYRILTYLESLFHYLTKKRLLLPDFHYALVPSVDLEEKYLPKDEISVEND